MTTVDLTPTWIEILNMVKSGHLKAVNSDLEKPCIIADIISKAQKDGKPSITFIFSEDGSVSYNDGEPDAN